MTKRGQGTEHPKVSSLWRLVTLAGLLLCLPSSIACASQSTAERPLRSPTRDYPAAPPQTSDGQVVGADGKSPADALDTGPTNEGLAPGWKLEDGKPVYSESDRVGGQTEHEATREEHDDAEHDDAELTPPPVKAAPAPAPH